MSELNRAPNTAPHALPENLAAQNIENGYIRQPHILRLYTSYSADHDVLLVEVKKTVFREPYDIEYHLGKILEYDLKKTTADRVGIAKK